MTEIPLVDWKEFSATSAAKFFSMPTVTSVSAAPDCSNTGYSVAALVPKTVSMSS